MERTAAWLAQWVKEAQSTLGLEVRGIVPKAADTWLFLLGAPGESNLRARWLLVRDAARARFHLVPPRRERSEDEEFAESSTDPLSGSGVFVSPLLAACRRALLGARIREISQPYHDRTIRLQFESESQPPRTLIAELFGAVPRFILLAPDDSVLWVEPSPKSGQRLVHGARYQPPPARRASGNASGNDSGNDTEPGAQEAPEQPRDLDPRIREFAAAFPFSFAASGTFEARDRDARHQVRVARLERAVASARERIRERLASLESDIAAGLTAPALRRQADVLATNLHLVRSGMTRIELEDLYSEGRVEVELDPRLKPHENLGRAYRKADKLERGAAYASERRAEIAAQAAALEALHDEVVAARSLPAIPESTLARSRELGLVRERPVAQSGKARLEAKAADFADLKRFRLRSGIVAWVGGSDRANDRLTHRIARGNDVWMHVQSFEGAHVVLRSPTHQTPSLEDLLDGARLAVHFSKRRGKSATVLYTPKKFVRKGRGKPGLALVDRHQELRIDPDDAALRALLSRPVE